jgi:hypothetical protein
MPEPTQQISIRIPTALLQEIETIAQDANIPRSQAIIEALQRGLGRVTQAESQAESRANHDGAIEVLRLELTEAVERIDRLERQANAQRRPTVSAQPRPKAKQAETGRTLGEAAHAIKLTQKPTDRNYDLRCQRKHGMKLAEYLASEGWTQHDRRWFPPAPQP